MSDEESPRSAKVSEGSDKNQKQSNIKEPCTSQTDSKKINQIFQKKNLSEASSSNSNIEAITIDKRKREEDKQDEDIIKPTKKRKCFNIVLGDSQGELNCNVLTDSTSNPELKNTNCKNQINFFINFNKDFDGSSVYNVQEIGDVKEAPSEYKSTYGKNFYKPVDAKMARKEGLKPIFIDGSNVAFAHGKNKVFSVKGLQICIDFFKKRGHEVKAFVPNFRLRKNQSSDPMLLQKLERENLVIITPTLTIKNEQRIPYDDWYIVQSAALEDGIIVSRDNYQDIIKINPALRQVIEESRLVPTFVNDTLIFPVDPLGNRKNNFEQFLRY